MNQSYQSPSTRIALVEASLHLLQNMSPGNGPGNGTGGGSGNVG